MAKTVNDFIKDTLRFTNIVAAEETPEAYMYDDSLTLLNDIINQWGGKGIYIPYQDIITFNTVANKSSYTIGPSGYDVTSNSPIDIIESYITTNNVRYKLFEMSELENANIYYPSNTGIPGLYLLRVYPAYTEIIFQYTPQKVMEVTLICKNRLTELSLNQTISEIPVNWYRPLKYMLAMELFTMYVTDKPPPTFMSQYQVIVNEIESMNVVDMTIQKREVIGKYYNGVPYLAWIGS